MLIQNKIIISFAVALAIISAASAQRRPEPAMPDGAKVVIALQVGAQPYHFQGDAVCQHAPVASIYEVRAEMWRVQQSDGQRSLMMTLWRPKSMSVDMISLNVASGGKSYVVNTVKAGPQSAVRGSGKVTVTPSGAGGTFTINATAADGAAISGTIKCSAFPPIEAVGG